VIYDCSDGKYLWFKPLRVSLFWCVTLEWRYDVAEKASTRWSHNARENGKFSFNHRFQANEPLTRQPFYIDLRFAVQSFDAFESSHRPINPWLLIWKKGKRALD
jgi:hypothetical protein